MAPSECLLARRVRSELDAGLSATNLPLFTLECTDRKAEGYADDQFEIYNKKLQRMVIGVRLADAPPAVSYLAILGSDPFAQIVAVDESVIVISLDYLEEAGPMSYLIYDAIAMSLRMIPAPEAASNFYPLSCTVSFARSRRGPDYALLSTRRMDNCGKGDFIHLWRSSSSSPPWSVFKKVSLPDNVDWSVFNANMEFSFNGHAYWVDLLYGVSYCSCDALFSDNSGEVKFGNFIKLPVNPGGHDRVIAAEPAAYRTMGVVHSFVRFVSIDGFEEYVQLKDRTVTVWKLLDHPKVWEQERRLSLAELWGFKGAGDLPKDLTPMYPLLSTKDPDVIYLVLKLESELEPSDPRFMLAVDMRNKIVRTFVPLWHEDDWFDSLISCGFSRYLCNALVGPCDDEGKHMKKRPIPMRKKLRFAGRNVAEVPSP